jgi:DNA helicase HerA-like ATPase
VNELQLDAESEVILCAGSSGSGKSTFALRLLVADRDLTCRFIFDPEGEFSKRLQLPAVENLEEWLGALDDGFVIFDPHTMFPGKMVEAFNWFCFQLFQCASFLPGRKIGYTSEAWKYCSPHSIPENLANCIQTGRKRGLSMLFDTQRPNRLNESITNEVTELVAFRLQGKRALERVEELGADPSEVASLAPGQFVAVNCKRGGELRGALW